MIPQHSITKQFNSQNHFTKLGQETNVSLEGTDATVIIT